MCLQPVSHGDRRFSPDHVYPSGITSVPWDPLLTDHLPRLQLTASHSPNSKLFSIFLGQFLRPCPTFLGVAQCLGSQAFLTWKSLSSQLGRRKCQVSVFYLKSKYVIDKGSLYCHCPFQSTFYLLPPFPLVHPSAP